MPVRSLEEFFAHRSIEVESRLRHIEDYLAQLTGRGALTGAQSVTTSPTVNTGNTGGNGSGSIPTGQIPESRITWDVSFGHDHDGAGSRLVPLAGDVTGDVQNALVVRIEGVPIPAPAGGNNQQYIRYNSTGSTFEYAAATSGAPLIVPQITRTSNYTVQIIDTAIWVDATAGVVTITLLSAVGNSGKVVIIKKIDAVNNVIIATTGGQTIDGSATVTIGIQYTSYNLISDGTQWWIV